MKVKLLGYILLMSLFVSGCGTNSNDSKQSSKNITNSSIKASQKKSAVKKSSKVDAKSTQKKSTNVNSSKKTVTKNASSQNITMNLNEIGKGVYASIQGEWQEVATSANYHNGEGSVWQGPNSDDSLTVTSSSVSDNQITLEGTTLSDKNDSSERQIGTMTMENGALSVTGDVRAASVSVYFCPKGVQLKNWENDMPVSVKIDTERIVIRTSNNSYVEVFERKTTTANSNQPKPTMNIGAIVSGDYTSLNGTWRNGEGKTIKVQNHQMSFSNFGIANSNTPGTITNLRMNIPSLNDSKGNPKRIEGFTGTLMPGYVQKLQADNSNGQAKILGSDSSAGSQYEVLFMPSGQNSNLNNGDASKDRIVAMGTQNGIQGTPEKKVYYRVN